MDCTQVHFKAFLASFEKTERTAERLSFLLYAYVCARAESQRVRSARVREA